MLKKNLKKSTCCHTEIVVMCPWATGG